MRFAERRRTPRASVIVSGLLFLCVCVIAVGAIDAQTLDEATGTALSGLCVPGGQFGPNLTAVCAALNPPSPNGPVPPGVGQLTTATGTGLTGVTGTGDETLQERLRERRKEKKQVSAAGDAGRGFGRLGVFVTGEYERFDKDLTRFEPGLDSDTVGGTLGADYFFTDWLLGGLAFNYRHADGSFDGGGGFDIDTYRGIAYTTILPLPQLFIDLAATYAHQDYSLNRQIRFTPVVAGVPGALISGIALGDTTGREYSVSTNIGYDFSLGSVTVGPRAGLDFKETIVDRFRERGSTGLEMVFDRQVETSLTTRLGGFASIAISTPIGVVVPQATFDYVHEFERDQRAIRFSFVEDVSGTKFRFQNDPPDRDYFHAGTGVVVILPGGFSPFVNYKTLLGYKDRSSHTVTAGLRFEF